MIDVGRLRRVNPPRRNKPPKGESMKITNQLHNQKTTKQLFNPRARTREGYFSVKRRDNNGINKN